jgi:hypothetical protein
VIEVRLSSPFIAKDGTQEVHARAQQDGRLGATLTHLTEDGKGRERFRQINPRGGTVQFEKLQEGVHRIVVAPSQAGLLTALPPVSDYVLVLPNG